MAPKPKSTDKAASKPAEKKTEKKAEKKPVTSSSTSKAAKPAVKPAAKPAAKSAPKPAVKPKKNVQATKKTPKSGKPAAPLQKALTAQKKILKGVHGSRLRKIRTSVHFYRPKTYRPLRNPNYARKSVPNRNCMDAVERVAIHVSGSKDQNGQNVTDIRLEGPKWSECH